MWGVWSCSVSCKSPRAWPSWACPGERPTTGTSEVPRDFRGWDFSFLALLPLPHIPLFPSVESRSTLLEFLPTHTMTVFTTTPQLVRNHIKGQLEWVNTTSAVEEPFCTRFWPGGIPCSLRTEGNSRLCTPTLLTTKPSPGLSLRVGRGLLFFTVLLNGCTSLTSAAYRTSVPWQPLHWCQVYSIGSRQRNPCRSLLCILGLPLLLQFWGPPCWLCPWAGSFGAEMPGQHPEVCRLLGTGGNPWHKRK